MEPKNRSQTLDEGLGGHTDVGVLVAGDECVEAEGCVGDPLSARHGHIEAERVLPRHAAAPDLAAAWKAFSQLDVAVEVFLLSPAQYGQKNDTTVEEFSNSCIQRSSLLLCTSHRYFSTLRLCINVIMKATMKQEHLSNFMNVNGKPRHSCYGEE